MQGFFLELFNMSVSACWLIAAVLLVRLLAARAPKYIRCILWAMVGMRLVCPFRISSVFSLVPTAEPVPEQIIYSDMPTVDLGFEQVELTSLAPQPFSSVNPIQIVLAIASAVWIAGVAAMVLYGVISWLLVRGKIGASVRLRENIYICDDISTPFILGIFRPRIYVPSGVSGHRLESIEAHEKAHLARRDHLSKPLGFAVLALHWFNPAVWLAYALFCRDIELACDERVTGKMDVHSRREYSEALLSFSVPHHGIAACPLAFGEVGVKERIKQIMKHKKPAAWIAAAALIVCAAVAACFLTSPVSDSLSDEEAAYLHLVILEEGRSEHTGSNFACESHDVLEVRRSGTEVTVYALVMYSEFSCRDGVIMQESGWHIPSVITLDMSGSGYSSEYWISDNGTRYAPSIREKFPWYLENRAIKIHETADRHLADCIAQAEEHYGVRYVDPYADTVWTTQAVQVSGQEEIGLIDITAIPDEKYPLEGDYLTLHDAIYCVNHVRQKLLEQYPDMLPQDSSAYLCRYTGCAASECTYFGSGSPCGKWQNDHSHTLPFHSSEEEFFSCPARPAWEIILAWPEGETESIFVDAVTGDMYCASKRGGYYPSPYTSRSEFARLYGTNTSRPTTAAPDNHHDDHHGGHHA